MEERYLAEPLECAIGSVLMADLTGIAHSYGDENPSSEPSWAHVYSSKGLSTKNSYDSTASACLSGTGRSELDGYFWTVPDIHELYQLSLLLKEAKTEAKNHRLAFLRPVGTV